MLKRCFAGLTLSVLAQLNPAHAQMSVPGNFEVSAGGAATYTIPVQAAVGVSGIEPGLALRYDSQMGNGLLGVGWSLSGLSAITRCPQTKAQDGAGWKGGLNYTTTDRFCLDGQRLVNVADPVGSSSTVGAYGADQTIYSTERESFSRIVSYAESGVTGGPGSFVVKTRQGLTMEYGKTDDSRIQAQGKTAVAVWALNKVSDVDGNYLTVTYTKNTSTGEYYPQRIDYTGNAAQGLTPKQSVQFSYESRADTASLYVAGSLASSTVRLAHIKAYAGTTLVKDYALSYSVGGAAQRSVLTSMKVCSGTNDCLPAVIPNWPSAATPSFDAWTQKTPKTIAGSFSAASCRGLFSADANGDGLPDNVCVYDYGSSSTATWVQTNTGTGFAPWMRWSAQTPNNTMTIPACRGLFGTDINGDGLADVLCIYDYGGASTATWVQLSTGTGYTAWTPWTPQTSAGSMNVSACKGIFNSDINGDGRPDVVCVYDYGSATTATWVQINTGTSFSAWVPWGAKTASGSMSVAACQGLFSTDINGDGLPDVACVYDYASASTATWVQINTGTSFTAWIPWAAQTPSGTLTTPSCRLFASDINGDGLPDMVCVYDYGSASTATWVQINTGTSFSAWTQWGAQTASGSLTIPNCRSLFGADINGDGLADIVCVYDYGSSSTATWVQTSTGASFSDWKPWTPKTAPNSMTIPSCRGILGADINGDGLPDLVCVYDYGNAITATWVQINTASKDLLASIDTGLGVRTTMTYKSLTDSSVYTKGSGSVFPVVDLQLPLFVVSSVTSSNGIGGTFSSSYRYSGLKAEVGTGRGMLGFASIQAQEPTGLFRRSTFRQDFPFTGQIASTSRIIGVSDPSILGLTTYQYTCLDFVNAPAATCALAPGMRYFVYANTVESTGNKGITLDDYRPVNDLPGSRVTQTSDNWGNVTTLVEQTLQPDGSLSGFSRTTTNVYAPVDAKWLPGRLLRSTVSATTP